MVIVFDIQIIVCRDYTVLTKIRLISVYRVCVCVCLYKKSNFKNENENIKTQPRLGVWPVASVLALIHVNLGVLNVGDE